MILKTHSWKYWWELTVGPQITIGKILANLNLVAQYGIAIHTLYISSIIVVHMWVRNIWFGNYKGRQPNRQNYFPARLRMYVYGRNHWKYIKTAVRVDTWYCIAGNVAGIKFGSWASNHHYKNIRGFKFGDSVKDHHTYICKYGIILADFNLAVAKQTAKPPNLIPRQIFQLYGSS